MGNCFLYKRGFGGGFGGGGGGGTPEVEKTASGKGISILDSTEKPLKGLRLFGKTTQSGTPSPDSPVPMESVGDGGSVGVTVCGKNLLDVNGFANAVNGVSVTIAEDGLINCKGTATAVGGRVASNCYVTLEAGKYAFNVFTQNKTPISTMPMEGLYLSNNDGTNTVIAKISETALSTTFTLTGKTELCFGFNTNANTAYDQSFYVMIVKRDADTSTFEPYKGQNLTLSTPNGLPGIHVSEGGNYTDENGWQWVCDEVDFAGGKYIQRVGLGVITEKNSIVIQSDSSTDLSVLVAVVLPFGSNNGISKRACLSDKFPVYHGVNVQNVWGQPGDVEHIGFHTSAQYSSYLYVRIYRSRLTTQDVAGVKEFLANNPISVLYQLETPIETALSAEELAQYAALHTYTPNTTIFNDADSYMEVKYMAKGG